MVDLNEETLHMGDRNRDRERPKYRDVVEIFKLLACNLSEARELLEVIIDKWLKIS